MLLARMLSRKESLRDAKFVMSGLAAFAKASAGRLRVAPSKPWRRRVPGIHVFDSDGEEDVDGRDNSRRMTALCGTAPCPSLRAKRSNPCLRKRRDGLL